jgi:hypothetical protein
MHVPDLTPGQNYLTPGQNYRHVLAACIGDITLSTKWSVTLPAMRIARTRGPGLAFKPLTPGLRLAVTWSASRHRSSGGCQRAAGRTQAPPTNTPPRKWGSYA